MGFYSGWRSFLQFITWGQNGAEWDEAADGAAVSAAEAETVGAALRGGENQLAIARAAVADPVVVPIELRGN